MPPDEAGVGEAACKTVLAGKRRAIGCVAAELGCGQDRWDHRGMMVQNIPRRFCGKGWAVAAAGAAIR